MGERARRPLRRLKGRPRGVSHRLFRPISRMPVVQLTANARTRGRDRLRRRKVLAHEIDPVRGWHPALETRVDRAPLTKMARSSLRTATRSRPSPKYSGTNQKTIAQMETLLAITTPSNTWATITKSMRRQTRTPKPPLRKTLRWPTDKG